MSDTNTHDSLEFETDRGAGRSKWIAGAIALLLVLWMGSGFVFPAEEPAANDTTPSATDAIVVGVRPSTAETITISFTAEGQTEAQRNTAVRSESSGEVDEITVNRGDVLESGQLIARIKLSSRAAQLQEAEAEVARTQREFENAQTLLERGVATVDRVASARSALAAAEAQLSQAQNAVADTDILAPFAGRLETLDIEPGEFVSAGQDVARMVDLTPLTVGVQVPQQSLGALEVGQSAEVNFITGQTRQGTLRFIGASADSETRTFEAEIEVPNEDRAIPAGISAQVRIPTGERNAHFLSPAILSLNADGVLGVKTVDADNRVVFHDAEIVRAQIDGVWVAGLPDEITLITVGQGFVAEGQTVEPRDSEALDTMNDAGDDA